MYKQNECRWRKRPLGAGIRLRLSLVAVFWVLAAPAYSQFHVLLSPQIVPLELRPGSRTTVILDLTNQDNENPVSIRLYAKDIYQGLEGAYHLSDTAMPYSCVDWLVLPDSLIEVGPGKTRQVSVSIEVPYRAVGGAYAAVVFEMVREKAGKTVEDAMAAQFEYRFQMPAWIEIEVKRPRGLRRRLAPGEIKVTPTADDPGLAKKYGDRGMAISAEVENIGNIHVRTKGRFIIRDENRRLVRDTRLGSGRGTVLPGAKTRLRTITKLPRPGKYTIKAIVEYGGRSPAIAQTTFEITSGLAARIGESEVALPLWIDMRPDRFEPSVPMGGFRVFGTTVMNREDTPVEVDVGLGRVYYDENGQMWVSEEDSDSGRSCTPWLTVEPRHFVLDPQRRKNVRITLNVPGGVAGGYYSSVIFNTRLVADTGAPGLPTPIYCPIFLTVPPNLEPGGEIADVIIEHPRESAVTLTAEFRNSGNVHQIISGGVNLQRWVVPGVVEGLEVTDTARFEDFATLLLETDSTYVLPGEIRLVSSQTADGLPEGRYRARVTVAYGGKTPATVEREFVIKTTKKAPIGIDE